MKKTCSRLLSLFLVLSLALGIGMVPMAMSVLANDDDIVIPAEIIDSPPIAGYTYMIRNAETKEYIDVGGTKKYNDLANGNSAILAAHSGNVNQLWKVMVFREGYRIVSVGKPGMMLNVFWANYEDGQPVNARERGAFWGLTNAQRFNFIKSDGDSCHITTTRWPDFTTEFYIGHDGTELMLKSIDSSDNNQKWEFIRTDSAAAHFADWFSHASTEYDHALATWAMELSYFAYNPLGGSGHVIPGCLATTHRKIEDELLTLGFRKKDIFQKGYDPGDPIAHTIAYQNIDIAEEEADEADIRPLVVVAVRGSGALLDWLMNGASAMTITDDLGFNLGRDMVLKNLEKYLKCPDFETCTDCSEEHRLKNPKIVITGHSLGAAVANLITAHLNDCIRYSDKRASCEFCEDLILNQDDIYGFTFATPRVKRDIDAEKQKVDHGNLFNFLNNNDVVTWIPTTIYRWWPNEQRWSIFGRSVADTMKAPLSPIAPAGVFGHAMSTYLRWMQDHSIDSDFDDLGTSASERKAVGIAPIIARFKCPVDVTIYDNDGNVVAQITDDTASNMWEESGMFAWVTEDGGKNVFLPYDSNLSNAHIVARDNGEMQFEIAKGDVLSDELLELKAFDSIQLEKGREYYVDLSGEVDIDDVRLMVTENNAIIGEVATDGVTTVPVKGISIVGDHQRTLTVGQTTLVTCDYIPTLPTNRTIIWDSSNEAVATVDIDGVVTAHSVGGAIITGTSQDGGYKAQCIITVEPETEISINGDPTIILNFGQQHQLTVDVTVNSVSRPITWSSSNEAIAVVSADGLVTAIALGNAIITATTKDGKKASVVVTVENETAITIKGDAARLLTLGQQHQLIAEVTNNSTALPITWSSSNEAVAPVTASGIVTASAVGSATITATTKDGYVAQVLITVEAKTGITIVGDPARILTQGQQHQLTADVTSNSTSLPLTWTSSNQAVATVTANGLVTAQSVGSAIITATTKDGYAAQVLVTVEAATTISISGDASRLLKQGQQQQLTANVTNNSVALPLAWSSSNDAVASVSASGLVTALTSGSAVITVTTNDGYIAQVIFTVEGQTEISIPGEATRLLSVGQQQQLTATVTQNSTSLPIAWTSSNEAVAPISSNGLITALSVGSSVITATTNDGYKAQVLVTVEAKTTITIAGAANQIATLGKPLQLIATVTQNSTSLPITWKSSNEAVVKVSADGLVSAQVIGSAMITATTKDGVSAQVMIAVEAQTEISIAGAATRILTLGLSEQLFATVSQNSTALPITWSSNNSAVASVNENGIVTANAIGSAMITATTKDGYTAQVMFTVESPTTLSISGIPAGKLEVGKPHQLTANVPHNSTALPIAWTSSNEAVATVSDTGLITPKSPGNTIITATTSDGQSEQIIVTVMKAQSTFMRWLTTFFGWLITPFRWLWNAIISMFTAIGEFFGLN